MKISSVMYGSEDPKKLADFYTKIFGEPGWQQDDWYGYDLGGCYFMIGSHSEVKGRNDMPGRIMLNFDSDDVQKDFDRIKGLGAEVVAEPYHPGASPDESMSMATFADPDGNYFQIATPWKG